MYYTIQVTTSQKVSYQFVQFDTIDVERCILSVMNSEKCPRRSIVKVNITKGKQ